MPACAGLQLKTPEPPGADAVKVWIYRLCCGNALDLDNWAQEPGLENWSYLDCLPYYRKAETRDTITR